jgi:hypothetical protein
MALWNAQEKLSRSNKSLAGVSFAIDKSTVTESIDNRMPIQLLF